jgi:hypothetical protein
MKQGEAGLDDETKREGERDVCLLMHYNGMGLAC